MSDYETVGADRLAEGAIVVGLIGGIASGKSLVAHAFAEAGAGVLDADRAGHEVLREAEVIETIRSRWGNEVLGSDGSVDRRVVAGRVFGSSPQAQTERTFLEQLLHPRIAALLKKEADRLVSQGCRVLVLDAPVLLEAGWNRYCDRLIFVEAPREARLARVQSRGWSEADLAAREAAQVSLADKQQLADEVINNSQTPEHVRTQVLRILTRLTPAPD